MIIKNIYKLSIQENKPVVNRKIKSKFALILEEMIKNDR